MGDKIELPDGGKYRVDDISNNKIRLYYNERVDGFSLREVVVKVPQTDISQLSEDGLTTLVNSLVHEEGIVGCPFCEETRLFSQMRSYSFAGSICETCWEDCVCRGCTEWSHSRNRSTRRSNKKTCNSCGKKFVTKVATG